MLIVVGMQNDIEVVLRQQAPAVGADSLMVFLDKVGTALGIATARQLHHFGPLVEPAVYFAVGGIIVIAIAFYLGIIRQIFIVIIHFTDIQIFGHNGHGIRIAGLVFALDGNVIVAAAIAFIRKSLVLVRQPTTQRYYVIVRTARGNTRGRLY